MKKVTQAQLKNMTELGAANYAHQEAWDIANAASTLHMIANMAMNEIDEPDDVQSLANIMRSLMEFISGEIQDMVSAAKEGAGKSADITPEPEYSEPTETAPAQVKTSEHLNLSYIKSIGIERVPDFLAVKFVAKDTIKGYSHIWGDPGRTDLEAEYFTKTTDFWDGVLGKTPRPLTWDHAQSKGEPTEMKDAVSPIVGQIMEFGDDEVGRWYNAVLDRSNKYNRAVSALIKEGRLGTSSDSAPQYVERVKTGKATWLKTWPFFAAALTDTPCEPRMIGSLEFLKSLGIDLPETLNAWEMERATLDYLKIKYFE